MSFTVRFTGQGKDEGIVVDSLAEAVARVWLLEPGQFPAAIWEIPGAWDYGNGRLIHKYPAAPDRGASAA